MSVTITNKSKAQSFCNGAIRFAVRKLVNVDWDRIFRFLQIHGSGYAALTWDGTGFDGRFVLKCVPLCGSTGYYTDDIDPEEICRIFLTAVCTQRNLTLELESALIPEVPEVSCFS